MSLSRASDRWTPGRRRNANKENLYFEPGKLGRKTGVTLHDTGIRDEHGFEPVSGIFATPANPNSARRSLPGEAIEISHVAPAEHAESLSHPSSALRSRRIPASPLKYQSPKKTHLGGSPVRRSARKSVLEQEPQLDLPADTLASESPARGRKSLFDFGPSPTFVRARPRSPSLDVHDSIQEISQSLADHDDHLNQSVYPEPSHDSPAPYNDGVSYMSVSNSVENIDSLSASNTKRKRASGLSLSIQCIESPQQSTNLEPPEKRCRSDDGHEEAYMSIEGQDDQPQDQQPQDEQPQDDQPQDNEPQTSSASPRKPKTNRPKDAAEGRARSCVRLRSTTPFEDDGVKVTRSGRLSMKPLEYWKSEKVIWQNGDIGGIVRAHDVEAPKRTVIRRKRPQMTRINEDSPDDLLPECWEEDTKIIQGPVQDWDPQTGSIIGETTQDIAFSNQSLVLEPAAGSKFAYARILNLDFFGAGIIEIPPGGSKSTKPSRKMQLAFFVHEGKVTVDVAGIQFGLTVGGVFSVPRGNNYSITNESTTFKAKLFYSQGCEADHSVVETVE